MPVGILVVEDEPMIQMLIEDICAMADIPITAVVDNVRDALKAIEEGNFKAVILDVNLHGETSEPIAAVLQDKAFPVLVSTGSYSSELPEVYQGFTMVQKPFSANELAFLLKQVAF